MTAKDFIVAIELGSSKLTGIAGKKNNDGSIQILAYAKEDAASFIRKGVVYNIDKMALSLTSIINRLEAELELDGASIGKVYVGISGQSLRSKKNFIIHQMEAETKIQKELIDTMMENNAQTPYAELEILDVVPQEYKVKSTQVIDPIGMVSNQVEGHFLNIVARVSLRQNLLTSFQQANIEVADLLIAPIALADVVLTETEKRSGCTLVDFGADTTTIAVYKNNLLRHLVVLPLGGNCITKDICNLQVDEADAEMLKLKYACAYVNPEDKDIDEKNYTIDEYKVISARSLNEIVEARVEEIIANILYQIEQSGYQDKLSAGYVLTGGGANLRRLTEAFSHKDKGCKMRIANFVQGEIRSTRPELLTKNAMLNTTFGLLAAGKENCCAIELPKEPEQPIVPVMKDIFGEQEDLEKQAAEEKLKKAEEEAELENRRKAQEREAEQIAKDDDFWTLCQDDKEWETYLKEFPNGRHAGEARMAIQKEMQEESDKKDDDFWEECKQNKQWKRYMRAYPEGRHIDEAEDNLEQQKEEKKANSFINKMGRTLRKFGEDMLKED